ncbi:unnamed protein product [Lasius platythorax]|uniref:Uncharacterized protein n=1 Tax=Lasius platythorax TaxID=488582 RepID=A0AAV2MVP6_9HYME
MRKIGPLNSCIGLTNLTLKPEASQLTTSLDSRETTKMECDKVVPKTDEMPEVSRTETVPEDQGTKTQQREAEISGEELKQTSEEHSYSATQRIPEEMDVQPNVVDERKQL